jgi:hypothetical protein
MTISIWQYGGFHACCELAAVNEYTDAMSTLIYNCRRQNAQQSPDGQQSCQQ